MMQKLKKLYNATLGHILTLARPSKTTQIGKFRIATTPGHPLAKYQKLFPLYDGFIPALCSTIDGTVIDIGANIGDTMAAILDSNPQLGVVCVEPDEQFFKILEANRRTVDSNAKVKTFNAFISDKSENYTLIKNTTKSTAHISVAEPDEAKTKTVSFSSLLSMAGIESPTLVKSDTDGFDDRILNSIADHLEVNSNCTPILFFEMQTYLQEDGFRDIKRPETQRRFFSVLERLRKTDYNQYLILDNFGCPIIQHQDPAVLVALERYINNTQILNNNPTMYFMDVVLYQTKHCETIDKAVSRLLTTR